ncbi:FKBP-type peptidyl-prolyl cis-trans isomerase [Marinilongibacter aquaticus]|uniref:FKBP-type peptidyl-prolyl cis-trans isomerase n=1 Tax=Marinilongibacter aquaticus TaxID=2975157 RepID=UPI0021BD74D2|nr:FKBP-type peptidyl-prolyl cis-trans isomerase [Marinilongibacter aquaticus]UBM57617.1 FKBP-type peptidyl-prolyl cis-trans isomerase [Marinilongibacter aquaticus]
MKLLRLSLALLLVPFLFSCSNKFIENESDKYLKQNIEEIRAYVEANNIDVDEEASGVFWKKLVEDTTAAVPQSGDFMHLAYRISNLRGGELINKVADDSVFYSTNVNVFAGFIAALGTLREGEKGIFYLPSPYAYADAPPEDFDLMKWEPIELELELIKIYDEAGMIDIYIQQQGYTDVETTAKGVRIIRNLPRPETDDVEVGDLVALSYTGYFLDSDKTEFDSGKFSQTVGGGGLIEGFEEALSYMRYGEKATIILPSELAYGEQGSAGGIPPNTPIAFDIEILEPNSN